MKYPMRVPHLLPLGAGFANRIAPADRVPWTWVFCGPPAHLPEKPTRLLRIESYARSSAVS